jgi:phage tail-like protein
MTIDALASYTFYLEIDGLTQGTFREGSGFESSVDVIEHRENGRAGQQQVRKLAGNVKWADITLRRGTTDSLALWNWHKQVIDGDLQSARKNGSVVVYDSKHTEVARFNFVNGWPSKWKGPDLNATNNQVAVEEITIVHEGLVRKK